jgi:hypothetical protein
LPSGRSLPRPFVNARCAEARIGEYAEIYDLNWVIEFIGRPRDSVVAIESA